MTSSPVARYLRRAWKLVRYLPITDGVGGRGGGLMGFNDISRGLSRWRKEDAAGQLQFLLVTIGLISQLAFSSGAEPGLIKC